MAGAHRADSHPELPVDPDSDDLGRTRSSSASHTRPTHLLAVATGGVLGAGARYALSEALPTRQGGWPVATLVANLVGAFALGTLLEALARRGGDTGVRQLLRLFAGTGFCGAFTTYSALAVEVDLLVREHHAGTAVGYAIVSVTAGLLATGVGVAASAGHHRRGQRRGAPAAEPETPRVEAR